MTTPDLTRNTTSVNSNCAPSAFLTWGVMTTIKISSSVDERQLMRLIANAHESGVPIAPLPKDGRCISAMDKDVVRDLRGRQFEREVRDAFDRATMAGCEPRPRIEPPWTRAMP
ncbi:hypothetical protein [Methylobacterium thuringiense]|uniref:hypothetical protein n=1 Tax=Methylobacterium thuringiense TaxID=1003091 RepID=UPI001EE150C7|nr:hypothetical protein [Methylobacterium thuringiense]